MAQARKIIGFALRNPAYPSLARAGEIRLAVFVSVRVSNLCSYADHQLIDDDGSEG
jgi:hypothetical protein